MDEQEFLNQLMMKEMEALGKKKKVFGFVPTYSSFIENPERENYVKAHGAVMSAIKRGELRKVSDCRCRKCGATARYYHHFDYEKENWLHVTPLCAKCHRKTNHNFTALVLKSQLKSVSFLSTEVK